MLTFLLGWLVLAVIVGMLVGKGIARVNQEDDDADL
jgi:hypothetical protein